MQYRTTRNWCFVCQKQFPLASSQQPQCPVCQQQAYEQMSPESHPEQFQVYQPASTLPLSNQGIPGDIIFQADIVRDANLQPHIFSRILIPPPIGNQTNLGQYFQSVLQSNLPQIMGLASNFISVMYQGLLNSGQTHRRATQAEVAALARVQNPKDCTICQSGNDDEEGYRLKCGHEYHVGCIGPWFERANTCPTCRDTL